MKSCIKEVSSMTVKNLTWSVEMNCLYSGMVIKHTVNLSLLQNASTCTSDIIWLKPLIFMMIHFFQGRRAYK